MATWPTSIPTDANLYLAVNELQNNLSSGINAAVTTVTLNSTTSFPTVGLVLIDNEIIKYTGVSGSNLTGCTRGFDSTTAATHSAGAVVSFAICAAHHNVSKDEIIALATYLSNNLGTGAQPLANGSRALASNGSGKIIESSVTSTELGYLSGVTSAIQTQLGLKAPLASPTFTGTITTPLTANRAVATGASGVLAVAATTDTELGYVAGVTSAIQTQLNAKVATSGNETITGTKTFSGQLIGKGTATNDSAAAGYIGERISASDANISFPTSGDWGDLVHIDLTAGDWDISVLLAALANGATVTAMAAGASTTSGNSSAGMSLGDSQANNPGPNAATAASVSVPSFQVKLSAPATYYLKISATYSAATPKAYGRISARRVR